MFGFRKRLFSRREEQQVIAAIQAAELQTSGEIRVHICKTIQHSVIEDAAYYFNELGMHQTAERNGVLIFIAMQSRQFAIIGDSGINEKVPGNFWDEVKNLMKVSFTEARFAEGTIKGIEMAAEQLKLYFPRRSDDRNELSDNISYGK